MSFALWPKEICCMKHDIHLIHDILNQVENSAHSVDAAEIHFSRTDNAATLSDHVRLLIAHNLVHGHPGSEIRQSQVIHGLTDQGRMVLHALGNESVRNKILELSKEMGEKLTFEMLLEFAKSALMETV